jgi:hypothetical protein
VYAGLAVVAVAFLLVLVFFAGRGSRQTVRLHDCHPAGHNNLECRP